MKGLRQECGHVSDDPKNLDKHFFWKSSVDWFLQLNQHRWSGANEANNTGY